MEKAHPSFPLAGPDSPSSPSWAARSFWPTRPSRAFPTPPVRQASSLRSPIERVAQLDPGGPAPLRRPSAPRPHAPASVPPSRGPLACLAPAAQLARKQQHQPSAPSSQQPISAPVAQPCPTHPGPTRPRSPPSALLLPLAHPRAGTLACTHHAASSRVSRRQPRPRRLLSLQNCQPPSSLPSHARTPTPTSISALAEWCSSAVSPTPSTPTTPAAPRPRRCRRPSSPLRSSPW
jgi:hypothetical protein